MQNVGRVLVMCAAAVLFCGPALAEDPGSAKPPVGEEIYQSLIRVILDHNPTLASQARVIQQGQGIREARGGSAITGLNFGIAAGAWNNSTAAYGYAPSASLGVSVSLEEPGRALDILKITQEKEQAKQQWQKTRSDVLGELFDKTTEMLRLKTQARSLGDLGAHVQDYIDTMQKQNVASMAGRDRLLELQEKLSTLGVELQDAKNRLRSTMLSTALNLGGDAWAEVLALLEQLEEAP